MLRTSTLLAWHFKKQLFLLLVSFVFYPYFRHSLVYHFPFAILFGILPPSHNFPLALFSLKQRDPALPYPPLRLRPKNCHKGSFLERRGHICIEKRGKFNPSLLAFPSPPVMSLQGRKKIYVGKFHFYVFVAFGNVALRVKQHKVTSCHNGSSEYAA